MKPNEGNVPKTEETEDLFSSPSISEAEEADFNELFGDDAKVLSEFGDPTETLEEAIALETPPEAPPQEEPPPTPTVDPPTAQPEVAPPSNERQEVETQPTPEVESDVVKALQGQIAELSQVLQEQSNEIGELKAPKQTQVDLGPEDFIPDDETFQNALTSREGFNTLLNETYRKMVAKARELSLADAGQTASKIARSTVSQAQLVRDFYTQNQDLLPVRDFVAFKLRELAATEPNLTAEEALEKVGPLVRRSAGLGTATKVAGAKPPTPQSNPAFPGKTNVRPSKSRVSEAEQEFNAVIFGG